MNEKTINEEMSAGKAYFRIYENCEKAINSQYKKYEQTHRPCQLPADHYIVQLLGSLKDTLEVEQFKVAGDERNFYNIGYTFCEGVKISLILPEWSLHSNETAGYVEVNDIFFTDLATQKTVRAPLFGNIILAKEFSNKAFALTDEFQVMIRLHFPGRTGSGLESTSDKELAEYYTIYKDIEALIMFHESAHPNQKEQRVLTSEYGLSRENAMVFRERDAWRYALESLRFLRKHGIDLVPGLSAHQIQSRIDYLLLVGYDKFIHKKTTRRFSNVFNMLHGQLPSFPFKHSLTFSRSLRRLREKDPTLFE